MKNTDTYYEKLKQLYHFDKGRLIYWGTFTGAKDVLHSKFLKKNLLNEKIHIDKWILFKFIIYLAKVFIFILLKKKKKLVVADEGPNYFIVSYAFHDSFQGGAYTDPYFSELDPWLKLKNFNVFRFLHAQTNFLKIQKNACDQKNLMIFTSLFELPDLAKNTCIVFKSIGKILFKKIKSFDLHDHLILIEDILNPQFLYSLMIYSGVGRFSLNHNISACLFFFENTIWEKQMIRALRLNSPKTKLLGHQHTGLAPGFINTWRLPFEPLDAFPDRIVAVGKYAENLLVKYGNYSPDMVKTGGVIRNHVTSVKVNANQGQSFLVALEASSHALELINLVYRLSPLMPEFTFVLRFHPLYNPLQSDRKKETFKNVLVSSLAELEEDLKRSRGVIYHGSSVGLEALLCGLPVFYYMISSESPDLDKVPTQDGILHYRFSSPEEFILLLRQSEADFHVRGKEIMSKTQDVARLCFDQISSDSITNFLP